MRFYTFDEINNLALKTRTKSQYHIFDNILNESLQQQKIKLISIYFFHIPQKMHSSSLALKNLLKKVAIVYI